MAIVFLDGFDRYPDSASLGQRFSVTSSFSLATGRFGTGQCLSIRANNGATLKLGITADDTLSVGFSFMANGTGISGTSTGRAIVELLNGSTVIVALGLDSSGRLIFTRGTTYTSPLLISSAGTIADGVWNHLEIVLTRHASTGAADIKLNGTTILSGTGLNTGASSIDGIQFTSGNGTNGASDSRNYDDLFISNTAAQVGAARIDMLVPSADTADKDWTPLSGTDNYAMVDETLYDGDTSYVSSSTAGNLDLYDVANLASTPTSVMAVQVIYSAKKDDVTARTMRSKLKSGSTTADGTTRAPGSSAYQIFADIHELDPDTSAAWTAAAVNAAQVGIEVVS